MRMYPSPVEWIGRLPKWLVIAANIAIVVSLGIWDYAVGQEVSFFVFYILPVLIVSWFVSRRAGVIVSAVCAFMWFVDDVVGRAPRVHPAIAYWQVAMNFVLFVLITHMFALLKNALEREKIRDQQKYKREMEIAREVQLRLFPQFRPSLRTLQYSSVCRAAQDVGGDYYDFFLTGNHRMAMALGDVSGKGLSAALLMATLCGIVRSQTVQFGESIEAMTTEMSRLLYTSTHANRFVSLFLALYDDVSRTVMYVNAGHNPPILFRHNSNEVLRLKTCGMVLGIVPSTKYRKECIQMAAGDVLVCFTDGLTEAVNSNNEEFSEDRVIEIVTKNSEASPEDLRDLILSELDRFVGKAAQHDDLTFIVAKAVAEDMD